MEMLKVGDKVKVVNPEGIRGIRRVGEIAEVKDVLGPKDNPLIIVQFDDSEQKNFWTKHLVKKEKAFIDQVCERCGMKNNMLGTVRMCEGHWLCLACRADWAGALENAMRQFLTTKRQIAAARCTVCGRAAQALTEGWETNLNGEWLCPEHNKERQRSSASDCTEKEGREI